MRHLETFANIAIVVTGLAATVLAVDRLIDPHRSTPVASTAYTAGETLDTGGLIDYSASAQNLIVVVDTDCRYCSDMMPLVRRVAEERRNRTRIVVVGPQDDAVLREYVRTHGVQYAEAVTIPAGTFKVERVPALIVANREGKVVTSWTGTVPPDQEHQVLKMLGLKN
jgi:hypothetical protein